MERIELSLIKRDSLYCLGLATSPKGGHGISIPSQASLVDIVDVALDGQDIVAGCEHDGTLGRQDFEGGPHSRPLLNIGGSGPPYGP